MKPLVLAFSVAAIVGVWSAPPVRADDAGSAPQPYDKFTAGLTPQRGLFAIWRKDGNVYLEVAASQLDRDYIEAGQPINGLGTGDSQGNYYFMPARLIRFSRQDNKIVIAWPNTNFLAAPSSPEQTSIDYSFAKSVAAVANIASIDDKTGDIVFDASSFLNDNLDIAHHLRPFGTQDPSSYYRLDKDRTYFGATKAFPENVLIEVNQTWAVDEPKLIDNTVDPRSIEVRVAYNIVQPPDPTQYMPRLADPRVGYFNQTLLDFRNDQKLERQVRYIVRWNFKPADPTKRSPATNPMVFYLSKEIPYKYRAPIRDALLTWNLAYDRIGITSAVQVRDQPDDPSWDPDDIRYSVVRWVSGSFGSGGAEAQLLYDPRTGEEFRTGITIDADLMRESYNDWQYLVNPRERSMASGFSFAQSEAAYADGLRRNIAFGKVALTMEGVFPNGQTPPSFDADFLKSVTLHESGHDMGLQHNFIGSQAYTAKQLQDKAFTARYGVVSSVMEYTPLNLWPKGTRQGAYFQTVLGPYDYYAIHWGYAKVPGARTPEEEVPTLNRWAGQWSNPWYMFASDQDVGEGVDPRVAVFDLTNDSLGWCQAQMKISHEVMSRLDHYFPWPGEAYDRERNAFQAAFQNYAGCSYYAAVRIGGEYLSRAHRGDPGATAPLRAVPRSEEYRAFRMLDDDFFADSAWRFSPATLNRLTYSEWTSLKNASWIYNPPTRHDVPVIEMIKDQQSFTLSAMFRPLTLERLDDMPLKTRSGETMSLTDLFDWMQTAAFGDLQDRELRSISLIHRNLQQIFARQLIHIAIAPSPGTPDDAQSLARAKLVSLDHSIKIALTRPLDEMSSAHLERLDAIVSQALEARILLPAEPAPAQ